MKLKSEIMLALHQGHYDLVIDKAQKIESNPIAIAGLICALALLGKQMQAENIWSAKKNKLSAQQQLHCCFHLAIAEVRKSNLRKAKYYLKLNLVTDSKLKYPETLQGIAFYHYYLGQYPRAKKMAMRAYQSAINLGDSYLQTLAMDMIAHCQVQTGSLSSGLNLFEDVKKITSRHCYDKLGAAVDIAKTSYAIEAGNYFKDGLSQIDILQKQSNVGDSYSEANMALLRARQYILIGRWDDAEIILNKSAALIYGFENRRQEVHLHIRLADIALRRNDFGAAQHLLRAARLCIQQIVDKTFEIRILLMEYKIKKSILNLNEFATDKGFIRGNLDKKDNLEGEIFSENPLNVRPFSEDLLNEDTLKQKIIAMFSKNPFFFDPLFSDSEINCELVKYFKEESPLLKWCTPLHALNIESTKDIIKNGYLGLLPDLLRFTGTEVLFILDNYQGVAMNRNGVYLLHAKFSNLQIRILMYFFQMKVASKENLIESIWKYKYDPLRHDSVVYSTVLNLRKCLESFGHWIETTEEGWRLKPGLNLMTAINSQVVTKATVFASEVEFQNELNYRQIQAMRKLLDGCFWTVATYKKHFQISTMSAWRDLNSLVKLKNLYVRGHGKLTSYHLRKSN